MRILLTGAGGLLGSEIRRIVDGDPAVLPSLPFAPADHLLVPLTRAELDVTDADAVRRAFAEHHPDAVLHCAAYTAVDRAESEPLLARAVNVEGAAHVARAAAESGAVMVYVSTDYVFDGTKDAPWRPDDPTDPVNVYGHTKLEGEEVVRAAGPEHMVVRTSWLYGGGGPHFIGGMLERARAGKELWAVTDQFCRPSWTRNVGATLLELLERGGRGVHHVADAGAVSRHEYVVEVLEMAGLDATVETALLESVDDPAPRPAYSVLDTSATEDFLGRRMPGWRDAMTRYLAEEGWVR